MHTDEEVAAAIKRLAAIIEAARNKNHAGEVAALLAADISMGWQSIDNAPTNGRRVLLYIPPYGPLTGHYDNGWHYNALNTDPQPTHFMYLPGKP